MYRKAAVLKADVHMFDFRRTSFRNVTDLVSESVQKWELLQLSGCSVHSSEIHFQEVLKIKNSVHLSEKALQSFQKDGEVFQRSERTNRVHGFRFRWNAENERRD